MADADHGGEGATAELDRVAEATVAVVPERGPERLELLLRAEPGKRFFRVAPARDPAQPRFWCLLVIRCTSAGVADAADLPWRGGRGMSRADLPAALAAIRADPMGWLAREECADLREWMLTPKV